MWFTRRFETFTQDLYAIADWLQEHSITTVALESTGVYWIPLFEVLEARGFVVCLVDTRRLKSVPGRKSDVKDCQWLQQLHTFGLLQSAFRPEEQISRLRTFLRQRAMLITYASHHTALFEIFAVPFGVTRRAPAPARTGRGFFA